MWSSNTYDDGIRYHDTHDRLVDCDMCETTRVTERLGLEH